MEQQISKTPGHNKSEGTNAISRNGASTEQHIFKTMQNSTPSANSSHSFVCCNNFVSKALKDFHLYF